MPDDVTLFDLEHFGWVTLDHSDNQIRVVECSKVAGHLDTKDNFHFTPTDDAGREIVNRIRVAQKKV